MTKTPEQLAEEHANLRCPEQGPEFIVWCMCRDDFLAGHEAGFQFARQQFVNAAKEFVYAAKAVKTPPELSHEEIRKFYVDNFGMPIPSEDEEAIFWAWTKSSHMQVISWLAHGFKTGREMSHKEVFDYYMELRKKHGEREPELTPAVEKFRVTLIEKKGFF